MTPEIILILVVLTNLRLLGASRIGASVRTVAVQGILLGLLALLAHHGELSVSVWLVAVGGAVLKGVVFPWLLLRALRSAEVVRRSCCCTAIPKRISAGMGSSMNSRDTLRLSLSISRDTARATSRRLMRRCSRTRSARWRRRS